MALISYGSERNFNVQALSVILDSLRQIKAQDPAEYERRKQNTELVADVKRLYLSATGQSVDALSQSIKTAASATPLAPFIQVINTLDQVFVNEIPVELLPTLVDFLDIKIEGINTTNDNPVVNLPKSTTASGSGGITGFWAKLSTNTKGIVVVTISLSVLILGVLFARILSKR